MGQEYRLLGGTHRRSPEDGPQEVFETGDVFEPTEAELEAIGDKLEPVAGAGGEAAAEVEIPDFTYDGEPMSSRTALLEAAEGELDTDYLDDEPENVTGYSAGQVRSALAAQAEAEGDSDEGDSSDEE